MGEGKLTVEYDDVQTIYHTMIDDLDNSITALTSFVAESQGKANPMAEYDLVYSGNFGKLKVMSINLSHNRSLFTW